MKIPLWLKIGAGVTFAFLTLEFYRWSKDPLPGLFYHEYRSWKVFSSWNNKEPYKVHTNGLRPDGTKEQIETIGNTEAEALQKMWPRIDALIAAGYRPEP